MASPGCCQGGSNPSGTVLAVCVFAPPRAWDGSFDPAIQFCPRTVGLPTLTKYLLPSLQESRGKVPGRLL